MSGFSHEILQEKRVLQNNRCSLLNLEVDVLEGHHALPKALGGSNNKHNCILLAGYHATCAYGVEVPDVHEKNDQKAFKERLFLHPDTLQYVTIDQMPEDCFRGDKEATIRKLEIGQSCAERKSHKKKKKHHK